MIQSRVSFASQKMKIPLRLTRSWSPCNHDYTEDKFKNFAANDIVFIPPDHEYQRKRQFRLRSSEGEKKEKKKGSRVAKDPTGASEKILVNVLYLCPTKTHPERRGPL